jgi:hypothetical protein
MGRCLQRPALYNRADILIGNSHTMATGNDASPQSLK